VVLASVGLLVREERRPAESTRAERGRPTPAAEAAVADQGLSAVEAPAPGVEPRPAPAPRAVAPGRARAARGPSPRRAPPAAEVRVTARQLEALVQYARLRSRDPEVARNVNDPEAVVEIQTEPIRIDELSIEPLAFDAEGVTR